MRAMDRSVLASRVFVHYMTCSSRLGMLTSKLLLPWWSILILAICGGCGVCGFLPFIRLLIVSLDVRLLGEVQSFEGLEIFFPH